MSSTPGPLLIKAVAALQAGDPQTAIALLQPALDQEADPRVAIVLGEACRKTGDDPCLDRAADRLLAIDASLVRPLIWKGDVFARAGAERRAAQFYAAALARADAVPQQATLKPELDRIRRALQALHESLATFVDAYLTDHGMPTSQRSPRIAQSMRILTGQESVMMTIQKPTVHFLPGLLQRAWYERAEFAWAEALEGHTDAIREELLALLNDGRMFMPYIEGDNHGPARDYQGLLDNPAWSAAYLWRDGAPVAETIARCPKTAAALARVPQPSLAGRSPTAMFSLLAPRTRIPAHHGMLNARLIAHLPLIVPDGCAMRVGDRTRPWRTGELAVFDDSVEHEAWNDSDETRVILLFDVARPELEDDEARAIDLCFRAIDAYASNTRPPSD